MRIAIYGRTFKEHFREQVEDFFQLLRGKADLVVHEPYLRLLTAKTDVSLECEVFNTHEDISKNIDLMISVGGDGTFLDTVALVRDYRIPILGINIGRLGFLANVARDDMEQAIRDVLNGNFKIDKRSVIQVESVPDVFGIDNFALNEFTVHKQDTSSMITIHSYINDAFLNSYWADGLIIATPTGSTAYSLSCEGPLVAPDSENFIITPIAPHNLNVRPFVINDSNTITLKVEGRGDTFMASLDSRSVTIDESVQLKVKRAPFSVHLVDLETHDFLTTVRQKLMWGADKRN